MTLISNANALVALSLLAGLAVATELSVAIDNIVARLHK